jgi:hypothetical protein
MVNIAPDFPTMDYSYRRSSKVAMLESRLMVTRTTWQPYILVGVGSAWNRLSHYSETPTDPNGSAEPTS